MTTENEKLLKTQIDSISAELNNINSYLSMLSSSVEDAVSGIANNTTQFYSQDEVVIYAPFSCTPGDITVMVMVEESPGFYRQVNPAIMYNGSSLTVSFDSPKSGVVILQSMAEQQCYTAIPKPAPFHMAQISLVEEPVYSDAKVPNDIYEPDWAAYEDQMGYKTAMEARKLWEERNTVDIEFEKVEETTNCPTKAYEKAMKVL